MGSLRSPLPTGLRFVAEYSGGSRPLRRPRTALVGYAVALVAAVRLSVRFHVNQLATFWVCRARAVRFPALVRFYTRVAIPSLPLWHIM